MINPNIVEGRLEEWGRQTGRPKKDDIHWIIRSFLKVRPSEAEYCLEEFWTFLLKGIELNTFPLEKMEEALVLYQTLLLSKGELH